MSDIRHDIESLVPATTLSDGVGRREFLKAALGTGFAAAVMPVCAQTMIQTDTQGLTAGTVQIDAKDRKIAVYRAQPAGKTNLPVVLVISEVFGVHEHIADMARRFAKQGYLALAPDLFARQGDPQFELSVQDILNNIIAKVPDAQVMSDLDACVAWATAHGGDSKKMGITGFCWGGRITWLYASHNPAMKAGVAWYGRLTGDKTALTPKHPVDLAETLKVPVLGLYGGKDASIPQESIEQMKAALAKGRSGSRFVVYPEAGHAFNADYRPSYVESAAKDGWTRCLAWFREHGVA